MRASSSRSSRAGPAASNGSAIMSWIQKASESEFFQPLRQHNMGSKQTGNSIENHEVVSRQDWLKARTAFLAREKQFSKLRDELTRERQSLPWVKVDKPYA